MQETPQPGHSFSGWELTLQALCTDEVARTVRFLSGAIMACGGFVLSRRFDGAESGGIEFEFARAACVEMYGALIAAGLELSAQSHRTMAMLCQCTRETLEETAGDLVRIEVTVDSLMAAPRCEPGGSCLPPLAS